MHLIVGDLDGWLIGTVFAGWIYTWQERGGEPFLGCGEMSGGAQK